VTKSTHRRKLLTMLETELAALIRQRGVADDGEWTQPEGLAIVGAKVLAAVTARLRTTIDGGETNALDSLKSLHAAALNAPLEDDRVLHGFPIEALNLLLAQPAMTVDGKLGPLPGAAVRTRARAERELAMARTAAVWSVVRTTKSHAMSDPSRQRRVRGDRHAIVFATAGVDQGGTGGVIAVHHLSPGEDAADAEMRVRQLAAIRNEILATTGTEILVILRAERRWAERSGAYTSSLLFYPFEQPDGRRAARELEGAGALVGEVPRDRLTDAIYRFRAAEVPIDDAEAFVRRVEAHDPSLGGWVLRMTDGDDEESLEHPDDVVVLDGALVLGEDSTEWTAIFVVAPSETTVFLAVRDRVRQYRDAKWDSLRRGLAALHGDAAPQSSDEQGRALTRPREMALSWLPEDPVVAANLDVLRGFADASENPLHWLNARPRP
jgi:hypothetical protein